MRLVLGVILSSLAFGAACAQENSTAKSPENRPAAYSPDLAEIMSGVQLRHFKLAFAGKLKNWPLADYELAQLRKNFGDAARFHPEFETVPVAKLIKEFSEPALDEVDAALKAKDEAAFNKAFGRLTEACDSCHKAAGKGFIKIRVPTASPFSNQVFEPQR
ncbi:MAG TPA: hypothetical protein VMU18_02910 [Rhodoblastus sp.]|nr:hypothetical protein [Rhodoblastus sp.]